MYVVHAAVLAINTALDGEDHNEIMSKLKNPTAVLNDIQDDNTVQYVTKLKNTKQSKCDSHKGSDIEKSDAYDFMLTQTEIQSCLCDVNTEVEKQIAEAKCMCNMIQ